MVAIIANVMKAIGCTRMRKPVFVSCILIDHVALAIRQRRRFCDLQVNLPPAHLSTAQGGGFTLSLFIAERQVGKL